MMFETGERVKARKEYRAPDMPKGRVVGVNGRMVLVKFRGWRGGHSAAGSEGASRKGLPNRWWFTEDELKLA